MPDTIQFYKGNQIINRYAADGRKLGTEYFTRVVDLTVPLITGQVINQAYTINTINQNGTAYIDNKEYNTLNGNPTLTALQRIYNSEGYADTITATIPNYKYYRRDHLGDNREVWVANTKKTIQRTQYYPSGLPWASNSGDNPGQQDRKYNGKEFIEMHGYDTYDYGARGYYAAMGRFTSVDPLCEKHYDISPYVYCAGNPVNLIDPDGLNWVYSKKQGYIWMDDVSSAKNTPKDYQYVGSNNNDILTYMGVSSRYETKTDNSTGIGAVGGDDSGPAGKGVPGATSSDVTATITIDTNVSYFEKKNITDNNKLGRKFDGVTVNANVTEQTASSNVDIDPSSPGVLSVETNKYIYSKGLFEPKGSDKNESYYKQKSTIATSSSIVIPASRIGFSNYLKSATLTIGHIDQALIHVSPTTIQFNLQIRTILRPSN